MILTGKTTTIKDPETSMTKQVAVTVKQSESETNKPTGLYFYLSVVPDVSCKSLVDKFAEGTVWKVSTGFVRRVARPPEEIPGIIPRDPYSSWEERPSVEDFLLDPPRQSLGEPPQEALDHVLVNDRVQVDGRVLVGDEFGNYCKENGMCPSCGKEKVREAKKGLFGNSWRDIPIRCNHKGQIIVYKGYCISPTCYTLEQAKRELGEIDDDSNHKKKKAIEKKEKKDQKHKSSPQIPPVYPEPEEVQKVTPEKGLETLMDAQVIRSEEATQSSGETQRMPESTSGNKRGFNSPTFSDTSLLKTQHSVEGPRNASDSLPKMPMGQLTLPADMRYNRNQSHSALLEDTLASRYKHRALGSSPNLHHSAPGEINVPKLSPLPCFSEESPKDTAIQVLQEEVKPHDVVQFIQQPMPPQETLVHDQEADGRNTIGRAAKAAGIMRETCFEAPVDVCSTQAGALTYGEQVNVQSGYTGHDYAYEHSSEPTVLCMSIWEGMKFLALSNSVEEELAGEVKEWVENEGRALIASLNAIFKAEICVIDQESEADTIVCTCGHQCLNHANVQTQLRTCPICRSPITAFVRADGIMLE
jgi:hypothetical protein